MVPNWSASSLAFLEATLSASNLPLRHPTVHTLSSSSIIFFLRNLYISDITMVIHTHTHKAKAKSTSNFHQHCLIVYSYHLLFLSLPSQLKKLKHFFLKLFIKVPKSIQLHKSKEFKNAFANFCLGSSFKNCKATRNLMKLRKRDFLIF